MIACQDRLDHAGQGDGLPSPYTRATVELCDLDDILNQACQAVGLVPDLDVFAPLLVVGAERADLLASRGRRDGPEVLLQLVDQPATGRGQ